MAGKIIADTIETGAGADISTSYVVNGSAKAWLDCDNDASLNDSLNIASGTDNGTGNYTHSLTSSMSSGNYSQVLTCRSAELGGVRDVVKVTGSISVQCFTRSDSFTVADADRLTQSVHGDLA
jgi:hypothetical protein